MRLRTSFLTSSCFTGLQGWKRSMRARSRQPQSHGAEQQHVSHRWSRSGAFSETETRTPSLSLPCAFCNAPPQESTATGGLRPRGQVR